jgi:transposase
VLVGIAVSKAPLDVALRPTQDGWQVHHDASGLAALVERLRPVQPTLIVLEATGGLAVPVTGALAAAGRPGVVVKPRHARDVAQATGRLAQTATREARGLAPCAEAVRPPPRPLPEAPAQALRALRTRRRPRVQLLTAARRRLQSAPPQRRADLQAHLTWVTRRVARTDDAGAAASHARPLWRTPDARLQSTPGVGPILSRTVVAEVPAVGGLTRPAIAALIGGAPLKRDRGTGRGTRAVWGGRAPVRAVRSMSTLAAVRHHPLLKAF